MFACQAVDLDFFNTAPIRVTVEAKVARPPSEVFAALAHDPANWGDFFPGFNNAGRFDTPEPHGVGSRRTVQFTVIKAQETILAWDEGARWAFRVDSVLAPVFHAFAEDYRVEPDGSDGTLLRWTMACKPRLAFKLARPFLRPVLTLILARAGHNLERGRWYSTPVNNARRSEG